MPTENKNHQFFFSLRFNEIMAKGIIKIKAETMRIAPTVPGVYTFKAVLIKINELPQIADKINKRPQASKSFRLYTNAGNGG